MSLRDNAFAISGIAGIFAVAALTLGFAAAKSGVNPLMTDNDGAIETVEKAGFNDVEATGYGWFSCGVGEQGELWRTDFKATNQNGEEVTGTVCKGFLKGSTIRFD